MPVPPSHTRPPILPPPRIPGLVIHCDISFLNDSQKVAYKVIISNPDGQITYGRAGTFYCFSPIISKARALFESTKYAANAPLRSTIFFDCKEPRHLPAPSTDGPGHVLATWVALRSYSKTTQTFPSRPHRTIDTHGFPQKGLDFHFVILTFACKLLGLSMKWRFSCQKKKKKKKKEETQSQSKRR
ncbi:hypothetical protein LINPERPRIM_LOCUS23823 [Linum perenne]